MKEPALHMHILASGSKGNAIVVEGPEASVLVDCGLSRKQLYLRADELGVDMDKVQALIVTHEHSDHVSGVSVFCNRFNGELFATAGTVAARKYLSERNFTLVDHLDNIEVCGMSIRTFPTSHDVADPFGLRFDCAGDAVAICTDTGYLTQEALSIIPGVRILALESNHDEHMLEVGPYPAILKERIAGTTGHLSNTQAAQALDTLLTEDTEVVVAMHLSEENNRPSICVRELAEAVGAEQANSTFTEAQTPDRRLTICAAGQNKPISIW